MIASVPLQGTYLPYSICAKLPKKWIKFPSPCRGLIFLTRRLSRTNLRQSLRFRPLAGDLSSLRWICQVYTMYARVSVPLQGTYLLYRRLCEKEWRSRSCFRPLTGDLSSLLTQWKVRGWIYAFPSPYRGLIFFTGEWW